MMNGRRSKCFLLVATLLVEPGGQVALRAAQVADNVRVRVGEELLSLAEAVRRGAADERRAAYRQLREAHGATATGQLELALWCRRQGLAEEEQLHWRILHYMQPNHPEAVKALRLQNYQGAWLTKNEVAQLKEEKKLAKVAERQWTPRLKRIQQVITKGDAAEREKALGELDSIRDPQALPIVDDVFSDAGPEVGLLIVEIFARSPTPKSTEALVRLAVRSPAPEVRKKAASELRYRSEEGIPLLIAGLSAPLELTSYVEVEEGSSSYEWYSSYVHTGRVIPGMYGVIRRDGNYTNRDVLFWTLETKPIEGWRLTSQRPDRVHYQYVLSRDSPERNATYEYRGTIEADRGREAALREAIDALKEKIREANAESTELNQRIHAALTEATGVDVVTGKPTANVRHDAVQPRVWWNWWRKQLNLNNYLASGTEVWTQTGLLPIEQILVGDRVLTRDPKTEQIAFNLVIGLDAKPQDAVQVVEVNSRTIVTTAEQPFYVADEGWRRADALKPGMKLHGLGRAQRIENVRAGLGTSSYSLLIDEVSNFFVDRDGILVHDATKP